jgi:hypothetical protein
VEHIIFQGKIDSKTSVLVFLSKRVPLDSAGEEEMREFNRLSDRTREKRSTGREDKPPLNRDGEK